MAPIDCCLSLTQLFPKVADEIKRHCYAGDFLASVGRKDDKEMMAILQRNFNGSSDGKADRFRILQVNIPFSGRPSNSPIASLVRDLFRSDHYNFWDYKGSYTNVGLKAVFLTDTGELVLYHIIYIVLFSI